MLEKLYVHYFCLSFFLFVKEKYLLFSVPVSKSRSALLRLPAVRFGRHLVQINLASSRTSLSASEPYSGLFHCGR